MKATPWNNATIPNDFVSFSIPKWSARTMVLIETAVAKMKTVLHIIIFLFIIKLLVLFVSTV